jgi:hypothetical protein
MKIYFGFERNFTNGCMYVLARPPLGAPTPTDILTGLLWFLTWLNGTQRSLRHSHFTASASCSRNHFYAQSLFRMTGIAVRCFLHSIDRSVHTPDCISMSSARVWLTLLSLLPSSMSVPTQLQTSEGSSNKPPTNNSRNPFRTSDFQKALTRCAQSSGVNPFLVAPPSLHQLPINHGLGGCALSRTCSMVGS